MNAQQPTSSALSVRDRLGHYLALAGSAALVLGSFLPWVTVDLPLVGDESMAGIEGDGVFTLVVGVATAVLAAVALSGHRRKWVWITTIVLAALATLVAVVDLVDIEEKAGDLRENAGFFQVDANPGAGLFIVLLGALVVLAGGILSGVSGAGRAGPPASPPFPAEPAYSPPPPPPPSPPPPPAPATTPVDTALGGAPPVLPQELPPEPAPEPAARKAAARKGAKKAASSKKVASKKAVGTKAAKKATIPKKAAKKAR